MFVCCRDGPSCLGMPSQNTGAREGGGGRTAVGFIGPTLTIAVPRSTWWPTLRAGYWTRGTFGLLKQDSSYIFMFNFPKYIIVQQSFFHLFLYQKSYGYHPNTAQVPQIDL